MSGFDWKCHAVHKDTRAHCESQYAHGGRHEDTDDNSWSDAESHMCKEHPKHYPNYPNPSFKGAQRVRFEGGGMRDSQDGKPRFDLLLPEKVPYDHQYLTRIAQLMSRGASHYEDRNWEKFDDEEALDRAKASAFRHFMQWFNGETDEDHAASIFFNVQAVEYIKGRLNGDW